MYNANSFLTIIADYSWHSSVNIYHPRSDVKMIVCMVTCPVLCVGKGGEMIKMLQVYNYDVQFILHVSTWRILRVLHRVRYRAYNM